VNLDPHHAATVSVQIDGISAHTATGQILSASAMDAHNTFEHPDAVAPVPFTGERRGAALVFRLPAKSVAVVALR
jgi:alpha-N-arabinofuranosidase